MKNRKLKIIYIVWVFAIMSGCKSLNTNLSIPDKNLPATFNNTTDSSNVASINWNEYFSDTLLIQLINSSLAANLDLQIALQRIEMSRATMKAAKGAQLPVVNANATYWQRKFGYYTMDDAGNRVTEFAPGDTIPKHLPDYNIGLTATWEIDVWGKLRNMKKSAIAQYLAGLEGKNFVVSNLIAEVAVLYYELLALDNELDIVRQTIQKQNEVISVISAQKEEGRANELALQQFTAQLLQTQMIEIETSQQIAETENRLNFLLGRFPQKINRYSNLLFNENMQVIAAGVPSQLLQNRSDIKEAELSLKATKFDLKSSKAAFFPNINISAGVGFQAYNPQFLFLTPTSLMYSALGSLITPIINRSAIKAQFNAAKANQISAMYHYQKSILNAYVEVVNELTNIEKLKQINSLKKQQTEVLLNAVETSNELYKSAKANYLEVLLAQQNSLNSQLEFIDITKKQRMASVNIYKALGGGWR